VSEDTSLVSLVVSAYWTICRQANSRSDKSRTSQLTESIF